uniref:Uncharacterized protein n=1 Tax=viral metagenome TaxID=1070528 RepID=A0A6M3LVW2_9ZZZZ
MGYTTTFRGKIAVVPKLNKEEIEYLKKFSATRRMIRGKGEYYCGTGDAGQDREADITSYNAPPPTQPSLWCQWIPTVDGKYIEWNGAEKFHDAEKWMWYLIHNFLKPQPIAKVRHPGLFAFLEGHQCDGLIRAQGEDSTDKWKLIVTVNDVRVEKDGSTNRVSNETIERMYCFETKGSKCDNCHVRFKCYTEGFTPHPKYGDWGDLSFWLNK